MQWAEVVGADWIIPAQRYKTGVDHVIPLSAMAQDLLVQPMAAEGFIFTTTEGRAPIGSYTQHKRAIDAASGVSGWVIHDIRRSARTLMSRAGIAADIAERCLGHTIGSIRGIYDRHSFHDEKAQAFEALALLVDRIVKGIDASVVPLRRSR
jgi:integrase